MKNKKTFITSIILSAFILVCSGCTSVNNHFSSEEWKIIRQYHQVSDSISDESYWEQLRKDNDKYSELTDEEFWNAVIIEIQIPAYKNLKIMSADSTASSMKNECDGYFSNTKSAKSIYQIIHFIVDTERNWSCQEEGYQGLLDNLKKLFPELKKCSISVSIYNGKCTAVAYITDYDQYITEGEDCPVILGNGHFADGFEWDGQTAGINSKGCFVGTAPKVPLGTSPEIPVTNVPLATVPQTDEIYYWSS